MNRREVGLALAAAVAASGAGKALAAKGMPAEWDGLQRRSSKRLEYVYLLPGADFRAYHKVMLDPTQVAFEKDWQRDYNGTQRDPGRWIRDSDIEQAVREGGATATEIFSKAFAAGGYTIVTAPGPDVLRVSPAVVNIRVPAPQKMTAGRSTSYAYEAGAGTLLIEARDSVTGALLARGADPRLTGDSGSMMRRSSVSNRADFRRLVDRWAKQCVDGLNELRSLPPAS
jgi:hypothetical protein